MRSRTLQVLATGSYGTGGSAQVSFTSLNTSLPQGEPANLCGLIIRLTKTVGSTVRPYTAGIAIRDSQEVLFDSNGTELLAQQRERGEAIVAQLGSASASDTAVMIWRPGYGRKVTDQQGAAGLFSAGSIAIAGPVDAGQTTNYEVIAVLDGGPLRVHQRAITRALTGSRDAPGDYLLARIRDTSFSAAATYTVKTNSGDILTAVSGSSLQSLYEESLGPAGDPVVLTAAAQTTLTGPNLVRSVLADYSYGSGDKLPPLSRLPSSDGNVNATSGFAGNMLITQIYPRTRGQVEQLMRGACARANVAYVGLRPDTDAPELAPYSVVVNG